MARPEVTGRRTGGTAGEVVYERRRDADDDVERVAYTIPEFCRANRISEGFYYKIRNLGLGPRETRIGDKVLISIENAAVWRNKQADAEQIAEAG